MKPTSIRELINSQPPSGPGIDKATLELLAAWEAEDATTDLEEIKAAEAELAEFKRALNENRQATGERPLCLEPVHHS